MTLSLLRYEDKKKHPPACQYSWFCRQQERWRRHDRSGDASGAWGRGELFVDDTGQTMGIVDPETNEVEKAENFVATLGTSNLRGNPAPKVLEGYRKGGLP